MKLAIMGGALFGALAFGGLANAAAITLNLTDIEPRGGHLLVAVQSRDQYMKPAAASGAMISGDIRGAKTITLPDVAPGEYAITVLHDVDGDMAMKMGADGQPLEGWTTKDARTLTDKPQFDQVKYVVSGDMTISQAMVYGAPR